MERPPENKYIVRYDYGHTRAWWVRIPFANIKKFFSDSAYGSKTAALEAAILFRDKTIRALKRKGARIGRKPKGHHRKPTKRTRGGSVGVYPQYRFIKGEWYKTWVGTYYPQAYKRKCKTFSVPYHGDKKAFRMAVAFRKAGLRTVEEERQ